MISASTPHQKPWDPTLVRRADLLQRQSTKSCNSRGWSLCYSRYYVRYIDWRLISLSPRTPIRRNPCWVVLLSIAAISQKRGYLTGTIVCARYLGTLRTCLHSTCRLIAVPLLNNRAIATYECSTRVFHTSNRWSVPATAHTAHDPDLSGRIDIFLICMI